MPDFDKVFEALDNKVPLKLSKKRALLLAFRDIGQPVFSDAKKLKTCAEIIQELQKTGSTKTLQNKNWNQKYVAAKLASLYDLFQETFRTRPETLDDAVLGAFQQLSKALLEVTSEGSTTISSQTRQNDKKRAATSSETQMSHSNDAKRQRANQTELVTISDDVLVLIMSFCDPLQLRAMWFVCRRIRQFLLANDRILPWGRGTSWEGADWVTHRETCLLVNCHDLIAKTCSGCQRVVPKMCILTENRKNPSCLYCLNDTAMVRASTAMNLFFVRNSQLQSLPHRTVCPQTCFAQYHTLIRPGHQKVYKVGALRQGVSTEAHAHSCIQKMISQSLSFGELRFVLTEISVQKQIDLAKRNGFDICEAKFPFEDESEFFEHIAYCFKRKLEHRCGARHCLSARRTDQSVSPRQLIALGLNASVPELRQFVNPDNVCNEELPPGLNDQLAKHAQEGLRFSLQKLFETVYNGHAGFYQDNSPWFLASYDKFITEMVDKGYLESDHCYVASTDTVLLQFVLFALEQPSDSRVFPKVAPAEEQLFLSTKERAFVKRNVLNPDSKSLLWSQVELEMRRRVERHLVDSWKEIVLEQGDPSAYFRFLKRHWERIEFSRKACFRNYDVICCLKSRVLVDQAMGGSDLRKIERIREFQEENQKLESRQRRSPLDYSDLAPVISFMTNISKAGMDWAVSSLCKTLLASFPAGSLPRDSLKTDRTRRLLLKELGGEQNLGETVSQLVLTEYAKEACRIVTTREYAAQEAAVERKREAKRVAAEALILTPEEMEEAGVEAEGPHYECSCCGGDHERSDCDEYSDEYDSEEEEDSDVYW